MSEKKLKKKESQPSAAMVGHKNTPQNKTKKQVTPDDVTWQRKQQE